MLEVSSYKDFPNEEWNLMVKLPMKQGRETVLNSVIK